MSKYIEKNSENLKNWPQWIRDFIVKYGARTANLYIVHGNIRDFLPKESKEGEFRFALIKTYISEILFANQDIIAYYDRSEGVTFCTEEMAADYSSSLRRSFPDNEAADFTSTDPEKSFFYLEKYFTMKIPKDRRVTPPRKALIIDYAETIIPGGDFHHYSDTDRYCLVTLNRWANNPLFTEGDLTIILLTENLVDLSSRLTGSSSTVKVAVPFPDEGIRTEFLRSQEKEGILMLDKGLTPERVASVTSGLNLMNLNSMIQERYEENKALTMEYLSQKKKEMIEHEAAGLLEFMDTEYNLDSVSGHDYVKKQLRNHAKALKRGQSNVIPMGYLIAGPIGTGKSFMVSAFAGEIGIPMVKFRNFRSKWQGESEANLEKVLNILRSMAPVAVMIDEADAYLGDRDQEGDAGTSNRVFSQIASFMGDTTYRGKIIWFLITCRPDLLPIDLKRQGRAEEHFALFYPETLNDKVALFETLIKKLKFGVHAFSYSELFKKYSHEISGADIEAMLIRAMGRASVDGRTMISKQDMEEVMEDFNPPSYPHDIRLQNLVAAMECTSKKMVPKRFQLDNTQLVREIQELKTLLGERK